MTAQARILPYSDEPPGRRFTVRRSDDEVSIEMRRLVLRGWWVFPLILLPLGLLQWPLEAWLFHTTSATARSFIWSNAGFLVGELFALGICYGLAQMRRRFGQATIRVTGDSVVYQVGFGKIRKRRRWPRDLIREIRRSPMERAIFLREAE